jgi:hypothetical protein
MADVSSGPCRHLLKKPVQTRRRSALKQSPLAINHGPIAQVATKMEPRVITIPSCHPILPTYLYY